VVVEVLLSELEQRVRVVLALLVLVLLRMVKCALVIHNTLCYTRASEPRFFRFTA
jgi:hypothetical protein